MKKLGNELSLILLMTDGTDYTAQDLCKHLNCTRRNLYYYLQFLRDYGFKVLRNGNCYRLDPNSPFFQRIASSVNFTATEAALLFQLADGADAKNPTVASIKRKLACAYDLRCFTDSRYRKKQLRNLDDLTTAINNRRVVCLHRYSSPHSHSFSDRVVEPFLFLNDHQDVRCYEFASGMNKTFKLARIGKVEIYDAPWIHADLHKRVFTDMFGFSGEQSYRVQLRMGQLSYNLMLEEYPISSGFFTPEDEHHWLFEADMMSYLGIGRFILGLYDDIEVLGDEGLRRYVEGKRDTHPGPPQGRERELAG